MACNTQSIDNDPFEYIARTAKELMRSSIAHTTLQRPKPTIPIHAWTTKANQATCIHRNYFFLIIYNKDHKIRKEKNTKNS